MTAHVAYVDLVEADAATRDAIAAVVDRLLGPAPTMRRVFQVALDPDRGWHAGPNGTSAEAVARVAHTTVNALQYRFWVCGAPSIKALVDAVFLVRAGALLALPGASVNQISNFFRCSGATAFTRRLQRMTGRMPSAWGSSAFARASLAHFERELQRAAPRCIAVDRTGWQVAA